MEAYKTLGSYYYIKGYNLEESDKVKSEELKNISQRILDEGFLL